MRKVITSNGWILFNRISGDIQTFDDPLIHKAALFDIGDIQEDIKKPLDMI